MNTNFDMAGFENENQNANASDTMDSCDESLKILSQETYAQLLQCLKQDSPEFTKILDHPGDFETNYGPSFTKCEISLNTLVPTRSLPRSVQQNLQSQSYTHSQFSNYGGQMQDETNRNVTYPDSGTNMYVRPPISLSPSPMSMIPSNQSFPGSYNFQFEFGKQPKDTKSTAWTYSAITNKLYAQKDAMCPIRFRIDCDGVANSLKIRALPIYSKPEYLQDVVKRCPNHVQAPESANIPHREHFIWCENQGARYVTDPHSGRYAVEAPYDTPPAGTNWVTYLYSFKCLNSCVGGPNRREMSIIFTLENSSQDVLGRVSLDLRICACPGRDRKSDENKMDAQRRNESTPIATQPKNAQFSRPAPPSTVTHSKSSVPTETQVVHGREMLGVCRKDSGDVNQTFNLAIRGRRNYEVLAMIRDSLEMSDQLMPREERDRYHAQRQSNDLLPHTHNMSNPNAAQSRLPNMTSAFNFSSALNMRQDAIDSTHRGTERGLDYTDGAPATETVAEWLQKLGLGAYIDNFHMAGLHSMAQLKSEQNFTVKDMESMNLTKPTVTKIWTALKCYRRDLNPTTNSQNSETVTLPDSQGSCPTPHSSQESGGASQSQRSVVSLGSGVFQPGLFELTRCSMKFTITKRNRNSDDLTDSYRSKKHKALIKENEDRKSE